MGTLRPAIFVTFAGFVESSSWGLTVTLGGVNDHFQGELEVVEYLTRRHGPAPDGQIWSGDDAALIASLHQPLVSIDLLVEGVHMDRRWCSFSDMGYKAVGVNVSDIAAMGGTTRAVVVGIAGASERQIVEIMEGVGEAAELYGCSVVGGDITGGSTLVISVCAIGECEQEPVRRSGARVGDSLYVTGPLGSSAAGLRALQAHHRASGSISQAHRRPLARAKEGQLLGSLGVHAMIDCSDGFAQSCLHLAEASSVHVALDVVPCAQGATAEEAINGGEDYELLVTAPTHMNLEQSFLAHDLVPPLRIGSIVEGKAAVSLMGEAVESRTYRHQLNSSTLSNLEPQ